MQHYANPSRDWRKIILALTSTQLELLRKHHLINDGAQAFQVPLDQVVIRFSDYTKLGQEFLMTGAIDKWMASCDRKGTLAAYEDKAPLEKRIVEFLKEVNLRTS